MVSHRAASLDSLALVEVGAIRGRLGAIALLKRLQYIELDPG